MKYFILFILLLSSVALTAQSTLPLRADTVVVEKTGGSGELKIKNSTRDSLGLLVNIGGGRTRFIKAKKLTDSTFIIGLDTLLIRGKGTDSTIYKTDGSIATLRTINFAGTGGLNGTNMNSLNFSGATGGFQLLANATQFLMTHFGQAPTKTFQMGDIPNQGIKIGVGDANLFIDTSDRMKFTGLKIGEDASDSMLVYRPSDGRIGYRAIPTGGGGGTPGGSTTQIQYNSSGVFAGDAGLTYDAVLNRANTDTANTLKTRANSFHLNEFQILPPPDSLNSFGDSFTEGLYASVEDSEYVRHMAREWALPFANYGVSTTGAQDAAALHLLNINPGHHRLVTVMSGFNDVRRNGIARTTQNKIINAHKAIYANQNSKSFVAGGSGSVTRIGAGWLTSFMSQSVGGKSSNNGAYTNGLDSLRYTFSDSTVIVFGIGADNSGAGFNYTDSADVYIDNVFVERIVQNRQYDGINSDSRGPMAWIYRGLTNASHTITIKNRHSGNYLVIDGFGHMVDSTQAYPLIFFKPAYNNAAGFAVSPNQGSVAKMDTIAAKLDSLKTALGNTWPLFIVQTNSFLDTLTGIGPDNIHPNDVGMRQLANAAFSAFNYSSFYGGLVNNGNLRYLSGKVYMDVGDDRKEIPYKTDVVAVADSNDFVLNQKGYNQAAAFRISDSAQVNNKLKIGNSTMNNQVVLEAQMGNDWLRAYSNSGISAIEATNLTRTTGNTLQIKAQDLQVGPVNSSTFTNLISLKNSLNYTTSRVGIGTNASGNPSMYLYEPNAGTNQKGVDWYTDASGVFHMRNYNDAASASSDFFTSTRSGIDPLRLTFSTPSLYQTGAAAGLSVNSSTALGSGSGGDVRLLAAPTPTAADQRLGGVMFGTLDGGSTENLTAAIEGYSTAAHTPGSSEGTHLRFLTTAVATRTEVMRITANLRVGIGVTAPGASLHLRAGNSSSGGAPFMFTSGTDLSSPVAGAWYYNGTRLGFSPSTTIKRIALTDDVAPSNGQIPIGNGTDYTNATLTQGTGITVTNGAGSITLAIPTSYITSGTYTPTITNGSNVAATTPYECQYMRVGDVVTVSGRIDIDPTAISSSTQLTLTLPITSAFAGSNNLGGTAFCPNIAGLGAAIMSDGVDKALIQFVPSDASNNPFTFSFTYRIIVP